MNNTISKEIKFNLKSNSNTSNQEIHSRNYFLQTNPKKGILCLFLLITSCFIITEIPSFINISNKIIISPYKSIKTVIT